MTLKEFVTTYANPATTSDEQAIEGAHYMLEVFTSLSNHYVIHLSQCILTAQQILGIQSEEEQHSPKWLKALLSIVAYVILKQSVLTKEPHLNSEIKRTKEMFLPFVTVIQHKQPNARKTFNN